MANYYRNTTSINVKVWWDTSVQAYRMASPYNKELVEALNKFIPASDRHYDPVSKIWTFVESQLNPLQALFKMLNIQPTLVTRQQAEAAGNASQAQSQSANGQSAPLGSSKQPLDNVIIAFMRLLPYDAAKTAYRKAALELHPDRGGDPAKSADLNVAWQRLEADLYKKAGQP